MSEPLFETSYGASWVTPDSPPPWLPQSAVLAMATDDLAAKRDTAQREAEAADRREATAMRCRQEGRDTSLAAAFGRADRIWRSSDYRADPVTPEYLGPDGRSLSRCAPAQPRREWANGELRDEGLRVYGRQVDGELEAARARTAELLAEARAKHPASSSWPPWERRS